MSINLIVAIVVSFLLMIVLPIILLWFKDKKWFKISAIIITIAYFIFLSIGVFGTIDINKQFVAVEITFSGQWFHTNSFGLFNFGLTNTLINLYMLLPVGAIVLAFSNRHQLLKSIVLAFCISLIIETMQFVLPINRTVELIDIILNTISGLLGYLLFSSACKIKEHLKRTNK